MSQLDGTMCNYAHSDQSADKDEWSFESMYPTPARLNGYDPYTYFKDVLTRLLMQRVSEITQILCITGRLYRDAFLEKPMLTDDH